MTKNLNVNKFRNGDIIPQVKSNQEWKEAYNQQQPAWCYYNNDPANGDKYGKLYNWYAIIDKRGLAPYGYHIPKLDEMDSLFKPDDKEIHQKLKQKFGWNSYVLEEFENCQTCASWSDEKLKMNFCNQCKNERRVLKYKATKTGNGDNSSGFSALPGGYREDDGGFVGIGESGLWSSCQFYTGGEGDAFPGSEFALTRNLMNDINEGDFMMFRGGGFSIRCLKNGPDLPIFAGKSQKNNGAMKPDQIEKWNYFSYSFELITPGILRPISYSKIYKKDGTVTHEIENRELFGANSNIVNKMINERLQWDFERNQQYWNFCDVQFKNVDLNNLTIRIDDNNMYFEIIWDNSYVTNASSSCILPKSVAEFELVEICEYILK